MSDVAVKSLQQAVSDLRQERHDIDRQIATIERVLAELEPSTTSPSSTNGVSAERPSSADTSRSIREIVLDLASGGEVFSLDDVVTTAHAEGNKAESASISSILSRLKKDGKIVAGPRRGTYRQASAPLAPGTVVPDHEVNPPAKDLTVGGDPP